MTAISEHTENIIFSSGLELHKLECFCSAKSSFRVTAKFLEVIGNIRESFVTLSNSIFADLMPLIFAAAAEGSK